MMDFNAFVQWAFLGLITSCFIGGVKVLVDIKKGVDDLNVQMAKLLEKTTNHERELSRLDARISALEQKQ